MSKKEQEALAKREAGALATVDFGVDESYAPDIQADERRVPYLILLQDNTPMVKDPEQKIPGAEPGMLFNSTSKELYSSDGGVVFVPCLKERFFIERTADDDARFVARLECNDPVVIEAVKGGRNDKNDYVNPNNGNTLTDTRYLFGFILNEENVADSDPVIIPFKKSKITAITDMTDAIDKFKPSRGKGWPFFAYRFRVSTYYCPDNKGYYRLKIEPANGTLAASLNLPGESDAVLAFGKALVDSIKSGEKVADYDDQAAVPSGSGSVDADAPF